MGAIFAALVLFGQKPPVKPPVKPKPTPQTAVAKTLPKQLTASLTLKGGTYRLTEPLIVTGSNIVFDGGGATLIGSGTGDAGVQIGKATNVTIKNLKITGFRRGISADGATGLKLIDVDTSQNANHIHQEEIAALHESRHGEEPDDGGGIFLRNVTGALLQRVQGHNEWIGATLSGCTKVVFDHCDFSKNDRAGVYLWNSSDNEVRDCRITSVGAGIATGGAFNGSGSSDDAAIILDYDSSRNRFLRNNLVHCRSYGVQIRGSDGTVVPAAEAAKRGWAPQGEQPVIFAAHPCDANVFSGNDVSFAGSCGFGATGGTGNVFQSNVAGFATRAFESVHSLKLEIKDNLIVGNSVGIDLTDSWGNVIEGNTFVRSFGSPTAVRAKGAAVSSDPKVPVNRTGNLSVFDNQFIGYPRPFLLDNAAPATLQTNTFVNVDGDMADDLVTSNGPSPLVLNSSFKKYVSPDMVASLGEGALMPSPMDTLGGVLLLRTAPGTKEAVVLGSLTGKFDGEEFELARTSGTGTVHFPAQFVPFLRVKGAATSPGSFLGLMGDQSLAKGADASATSNEKTAGFVTDGDWDTPGQVWEASYEENQSIRIDIPRTKMVDTITIAPDVRDGSAFWKQFHIEVSDTGDFRGEQTTVVTEKDWDRRPGQVRVYRFPAVRASAIRIIGDMAQKDVRLQELGVYGNGG